MNQNSIKCNKVYTFREVSTIAQILKTKKYVAFAPTDTVNGIVSLSPSLIYKIKNRDKKKKLILFVNDINQVKGLSHFEKKILQKFWPGKLTIIKNGISYRFPNSNGIKKLIKLTGPLYSSSANISNSSPIHNTIEAFKIFKKSKVNFIVIKQNKFNASMPSTIIDLDRKSVIRKGLIDGNKIINEIEKNSRFIFIASDHAGYEMKKAIVNYFKNDLLLKDLGCYSKKSVDYPIFAAKVAKQVIKNNSIGILICGTGFGMCIAANKFRGVRAVNIINPKMAHLAKEHNDCNIICLSAIYSSFSNNVRIINNFLNSYFDINDPKNFRHIRRIKQISMLP